METVETIVEPTHVLFLNAGYIYLLQHSESNYIPYVYKLTKEQYDNLYEWVHNHGAGECSIVLDNVTLRFVHDYSHPLRMAETTFSTMRMTKRLGASVVSAT